MAHKKHENEKMAPAMCMYYDTLMGPQFELARAYVPIQMYTRQYNLEVALERGTLFPELYRPYPL